jgi:hypothetical protein
VKDATPCAARGLEHEGRFCPVCGEPVIDPSALTLRHLGKEVVRGLFDLDGRLWRTLLDLLRQPGALTAAWADGPRSRYLSVSSVFLTVTVVVFLVAPWIGVFAFDLDNYLNVGLGTGAHLSVAHAAVEASPLDGAAWTMAFDETLAELKRFFLVLLVPALALPVAAIAPRGARPFAVHVVFAVHACAFMLIWLSIVAAIGTGAKGFVDGVGGAPAAVVTTIALTVPMVAWLASAIRRVYGGGAPSAGLRAAALLFGATLLVVVYREALFWATLAVV